MVVAKVAQGGENWEKLRKNWEKLGRGGEKIGKDGKRREKDKLWIQIIKTMFQIFLYVNLLYKYFHI